MTDVTPTPARRGRPRKYTDAQLIANLVELTDANGVAPGAKELNAKDGRPSLQAYITTFGSLNVAKEKAGLETRGVGRPRTEKDDAAAPAPAAAAPAVDAAAPAATFTTITDAALHVLADGPMTANQVAAAVKDMVTITSKNPRKSVQEALHRAPGVAQAEGVFTLATA